MKAYYDNGYTETDKSDWKTALGELGISPIHSNSAAPITAPGRLPQQHVTQSSTAAQRSPAERLSPHPRGGRADFAPQAGLAAGARSRQPLARRISPETVAPARKPSRAAAGELVQDSLLRNGINDLRRLEFLVQDTDVQSRGVILETIFYPDSKPWLLRACYHLVTYLQTNKGFTKAQAVEAIG
ncbi:hypothetical protein GGTG_09107 [Gaeumannomyces tritici R3-111a-1]|uniref:Uncharacterized protein n=1 Tax=Gaeumannomyces tritici (strain R3-111a-1) TaxID=644352 RepID=J3P6G7_GAET3|nr:hypothetical protein GGTG_09107 [Gaeumannomyces tritici R3-111a-1]EJT72241.1 hypothetical protein GGTG_09107 [Gaeumannomyces tritici R3-111a-1]